MWRSGETGLMSLAVDPDFADNRRFYTCQGDRPAGGRPEVDVVAWRLGPGARRAIRVRTLLSGMPATADGRHGGCRLLVLRDGSLLVGTGDGTVGTNPRNLASYGGKTLRLDAHHRGTVAGQPVREARSGRPSATSSPTATATCRAWPSAATARCGRSSTAATATTR